MRSLSQVPPQKASFLQADDSCFMVLALAFPAWQAWKNSNLDLYTTHLGQGLGLTPLAGELGNAPEDDEGPEEAAGELGAAADSPPPLLTPPPAGPEMRLAPVTAAPVVPCPGPGWKACSCGWSGLTDSCHCQHEKLRARCL